MNIDDKDKLIINALLGNARLSLRQIAQKIGFSVATVMHRVNNLEKNKVIKQYCAIIDYEKLGLDIEVIVEIRISKGKLFEVEKKIASNPSVFAVYDVTGDSDAIILARFGNRRQMDQFIKKVQSYDFVERTNTKLILHTIKETQIAV